MLTKGSNNYSDNDKTHIHNHDNIGNKDNAKIYTKNNHADTGNNNNDNHNKIGNTNTKNRNDNGSENDKDDNNDAAARGADLPPGSPGRSRAEDARP